MTAETPTEIMMFGADWCGDCRRAAKVFRDAQIAYTYVDLVAHPEAADVAKDISGRTNIPVITYPDGSHHVEPSNDDIMSKLAELGLV